jgi:hypothetical protein
MYGARLALLLIPLIAGEPKSPLSFTFRVEDVRPGCSEDGVGYPVSVIIHVAVTNLSGRPLILSREFAAAPYYRVAASPESGSLGEYEPEGGDLEVVAGEAPQPTFGDMPDPARFVVLAPGSTYETEVTVGVLAFIRQALELLAPGKTGGLIFAGTHAIQCTIRTWPHVFAKPTVVPRLRRQWRDVGELVTIDARTPFLSFELPNTTGRCKAPSR